jgi:serine protease Do
MNRKVESSRPLQGIGLSVLLLALVAALPASAFSQTPPRSDAAATLSPPQVARELSQAFEATAKATMPAVVSIKIEKIVTAQPGFGDSNDTGGPEDFLRRFFGAPGGRSPERFLERGQGSGFIISRDGYILTNNHVVGNVDRMTVTLQDGRTFTDAKVIGTDPATEVALIKIEGNDFPVLPLGDSDRLEVGDMVMAIGNPFGLSGTVTVGVISAVRRTGIGIAAYENFIQTDAAINPGNSGGPLVDLNGRAIGINTAIVSESGGYMGIGFAIPINMARTVADQLRKTGKVVRGYMGFYGQDVTPEIAQSLGLKEARGVIIAQVERTSPAAEAELRPGDVVLEMNGNPIGNYDAFRNAIAALRPGTAVQLLVWRDGKTFEQTVTLGERPAESARAGQPQQTPSPRTPQEARQTLGLDVQNVTRGLAQRFGYQPGEGVIVTAVTPEGPASNAGIRPGDLIVSVNRQSVPSVDRFVAAVRAARKSGQALLLVRRREASQFVVVRFRGQGQENG